MGKGTQVWPTVPIPISRHFHPLVAPVTAPARASTLSSGPWPPLGCSLPPGHPEGAVQPGHGSVYSPERLQISGEPPTPPPRPVLSMRPGHLSYFTVLHCVLGGPVSRTMPTRLCITRTTLSSPLAIQAVYVISRKSYKDSFPQYFSKVCCSLHTMDKLWTP